MVLRSQCKREYHHFIFGKALNGMSHAVLCSEHLDSEAIVEYVKALVLIAEEELQPVNHPRVFSLTKIVEISDFNMGRIR